MKTQLTTTVAAAAIALSSFNATPAQALTDDEAVALLIGAVAVAAFLNSNHPAPTPAPTPVTYSTGPIQLKQTYTADFDHGTVGTPGADLWFQAVTATQLYLKPQHGAKIAVGDRSNRGFAGCSTASYTSHRVALAAVPVGSYVCMKTSQGRISQFRMNSIYGPINHRKLALGYTTWQ